MTTTTTNELRYGAALFGASRWPVSIRPAVVKREADPQAAPGSRSGPQSKARHPG